MNMIYKHTFMITLKNMNLMSTPFGKSLNLSHNILIHPVAVHFGFHYAKHIDVAPVQYHNFHSFSFMRFVHHEYCKEVFLLLPQ